MAGNTYSFLDCKASLVGPGGFINLADGAGNSEEGITITPTGPINQMAIGADGSVMHNLFADKSGKISISLLKTSPVNAQLSLMYAAQTASAAGHGQNTLVIRDTTRGDIVTCTQCAFAKAPDLGYAKVGPNNVWEFDAGKIDRNLGAG